jgi:hypothetical protein
VAQVIEVRVRKHDGPHVAERAPSAAARPQASPTTRVGEGVLDAVDAPATSANSVPRSYRDDWSEHQPSSRDENAFTAEHGWDAYARWPSRQTRPPPRAHQGALQVPFGDLQDVHRCAILSAESHAAPRRYKEVERAVAHLHGMLELLRRRA